MRRAYAVKRSLGGSRPVTSQCETGNLPTAVVPLPGVKITLTDETESRMTAGDGDDPDAAVWDRLRAGDRDALGVLFDRYADDVHAFAFRRTASATTAEDVVQATFLSTWRRLQRNDPGPLTAPSAKGWLLVVAANECRGVFRTTRRLRALLDRIPPGEPDADHAAEVARRVDDEQRMSAIRRAVDRLPRHERDTLELVIWSGLTIADTASALGVPEGTVKARLHRARRRLPGLLSRADLAEEL
jgi:RNA polymerase sigma-70 factor, ECF subfamily